MIVRHLQLSCRVGVFSFRGPAGNWFLAAAAGAARGHLAIDTEFFSNVSRALAEATFYDGFGKRPGEFILKLCQFDSILWTFRSRDAGHGAAEVQFEAD